MIYNISLSQLIAKNSDITKDDQMIVQFVNKPAE